MEPHFKQMIKIVLIVIACILMAITWIPSLGWSYVLLNKLGIFFFGEVDWDIYWNHTTNYY
jgi:hypothetical protein